MVARRRREKPHAVLNRAAFGIGSAEVEPADTCEGYRRRAHRARLQRHMEIAVGEPLAAERARRRANGDELGMRGGVAIGKRTIAGAGDHLVIAHDDAADRHLAMRTCGAGFLECDLHERWRSH